MKQMSWIGTLSFCCVLAVTSSKDLSAEEWSIPVAGNAFRTAPTVDGEGLRRNGFVWGDEAGVLSVYFHLDRGAVLDLAINAKVPEGKSLIEADIGSEKLSIAMEGKEFNRHELGKIEIKQAGYVRVDLKGTKREGTVFAEVRDLILRSSTTGLVVDYVKTNDGNMFYWGRRGPSVHLSYSVPRDQKIEYAYSEITVPKDQDPIGSYYMANGFGEGYFGIQVNGPNERRVLFSIWSPFQTDNPKEIPEDQRIVLLAKGPEVRVGEFGNEGSGGQSFLVYPWVAGKTYGFLTQVKPDGEGRTIYTSWFGDKQAGEWRLIASFRRPKTDTYLRGFHSFLESFDPSRGHLGRRANYGNPWVRDIEGRWHECTRARFSVDPTGGGRHRLDFNGGAEGNVFFLRNCGFFNETGNAGETFTRVSSEKDRPDIDFAKLPRG